MGATDSAVLLALPATAAVEAMAAGFDAWFSTAGFAALPTPASATGAAAALASSTAGGGGVALRSFMAVLVDAIRAACDFAAAAETCSAGWTAAGCATTGWAAGGDAGSGAAAATGDAMSAGERMAAWLPAVLGEVAVGGIPRICQARPAASTSVAALLNAISQRGPAFFRLKDGAALTGPGGFESAAEPGFGCTQSPRSRGCLRRSGAAWSASCAPDATACAAARSTAASSAALGSFCGSWRYSAASPASSGSSSSGSCGGSWTVIRTALRVNDSWHSAGAISPSRGRRRSPRQFPPG